MFKRFAKSTFAARIASFLIGVYVRLVYWTSRWTFIGVDQLHNATAQGRGVILAFWHGRILMIPPSRRVTDKRIFMLISSHRDGEIIANAVRSFKIDFIRGSAANPKKPEKDKSGAPAITQMIAALEGGDIVGVTPDGPRGPRGRSKVGVIRLAQMSGAPIIPIAYSASRGRELGSWDKFLLAAPFSRGYYVAGAPIRIPKNAERQAVESARRQLETGLDRVTREADALAGRPDMNARGEGNTTIAHASKPD